MNFKKIIGNRKLQISLLVVCILTVAFFWGGNKEVISLESDEVAQNEETFDEASLDEEEIEENEDEDKEDKEDKESKNKKNEDKKNEDKKNNKDKDKNKEKKEQKQKENGLKDKKIKGKQKTKKEQKNKEKQEKQEKREKPKQEEQKQNTEEQKSKQKEVVEEQKSEQQEVSKEQKTEQKEVSKKQKVEQQKVAKKQKAEKSEIIAQDKKNDGKKDKYKTDPIPEGKPEPEEWQDTEVDEEKEMTATLSISARSILNNIDMFDEDKMEVLPEDGMVYETQEVTFYEGESVFDVLLRETQNNKIHMEFNMTPVYNSNYVEGINNLYEFDCGELSGWMYKVNGWFPNYGSSRYELEDGDKIVWEYTCDLGRDIGGEKSTGGN